MAYKLNRGPKLLAAGLGALALFGGARYAVTHGLLTPTAADSKVPERANLPALQEVEAGEAEPSAGAHFVAIMGDGAAQFFASLNPMLAKLGPEYRAEVIASAGYSRGEDKFMGLPAWKKSAESARGAYIAGYLKDGD